MNRAPGVSGLDQIFVIPTQIQKLLVHRQNFGSLQFFDISEFPSQWPMPAQQWSILASVLQAGVPTVIGIFRRQLPCSGAQPTCSDTRRKLSAALLQKQFETIQTLLCSEQTKYVLMDASYNKIASQNIPTRCLAETQCCAETIIQTCAKGDMCTWHPG